MLDAAITYITGDATPLHIRFRYATIRSLTNEYINTFAICHAFRYVIAHAVTATICLLSMMPMMLTLRYYHFTMPGFRQILFS